MNLEFYMFHRHLRTEVGGAWAEIHPRGALQWVSFVYPPLPQTLPMWTTQCLSHHLQTTSHAYEPSEIAQKETAAAVMCSPWSQQKPCTVDLVCKTLFSWWWCTNAVDLVGKTLVTWWWCTNAVYLVCKTLVTWWWQYQCSGFSLQNSICLIMV